MSWIAKLPPFFPKFYSHITSCSGIVIAQHKCKARATEEELWSNLHVVVTPIEFHVEAIKTPILFKLKRKHQIGFTFSCFSNVNWSWRERTKWKEGGLHRVFKLLPSDLIWNILFISHTGQFRDSSKIKNCFGLLNILVATVKSRLSRSPGCCILALSLSGKGTAV